jgi:hypothetical protein
MGRKRWVYGSEKVGLWVGKGGFMGRKRWVYGSEKVGLCPLEATYSVASRGRKSLEKLKKQQQHHTHARFNAISRFFARLGIFCCCFFQKTNIKSKSKSSPPQGGEMAHRRPRMPVAAFWRITPTPQ